MPSDALKGLHRVKRSLADGTERVHYYAWRGGPRLECDYGTPEFAAEFALLTGQAAADRREAQSRTLARILDGYQDSAKFAQLAARTRADYAAILDRLRTKFGPVTFADLGSKGTRADFLDWRDEFGEDNARQADYHWTVLNIAMNWAVDREMVERNPFARAGKLYGTSRAEKIWLPAHEAAILAVAPPHLALPFLLALYTGQRQGDLLALRWANYDGMRISLRQGKTGARVTVKLVSKVKAALDATPREHERILITARGGTPWTEDGFRASWGKLKTEAKITGLTFHDLRGTAVTRFFLAGATEAEIATITGHSLKDVRSILDIHYFHRDSRLADAGIDKLEGAMSAEANPANDDDAAVPQRKPKQFNGYTGRRRLQAKNR